MPVSAARIGRKANRLGAESWTANTRSVDTTGLIANVCRAAFGRKTWAQLSEITGLSERAAKSRLAHERDFTIHELRALLRSEQGIHFLVALMDEARPAWWSALLRMGMLGGIARRRAADLRLLRKVAHADQATTAALPAALLVQDQDFYSPVVEALESVARRQGGPMDGER